MVLMIWLTHYHRKMAIDLKKVFCRSTRRSDIIFQCFDRLQMIIDQIEVNGSEPWIIVNLLVFWHQNRRF